MFAPVPFFGRGGDPPPLRVRLVHKRAAWDVVVDARATFGELRVGMGHTRLDLPLPEMKSHVMDGRMPACHHMLLHEAISISSSVMLQYEAKTLTGLPMDAFKLLCAFSCPLHKPCRPCPRQRQRHHPHLHLHLIRARMQPSVRRPRSA